MKYWKISAGRMMISTILFLKIILKIVCTYILLFCNWFNLEFHTTAFGYGLVDITLTYYLLARLIRCTEKYVTDCMLKCQAARYWGLPLRMANIDIVIIIYYMCQTTPGGHINTVISESWAWYHNEFYISLIDSMATHIGLWQLMCNFEKKTSKLHVTGLCVGNSMVTVEFPAQMASNAEKFSIWWRHHLTSAMPRHVMSSQVRGDITLLKLWRPFCTENNRDNFSQMQVKLTKPFKELWRKLFKFGEF